LLDVGLLDDVDSIWIDGISVIDLEKEARRVREMTYSVPAQAIRPGLNRIAIRAIRSVAAKDISGRGAKMRLADDPDSDAITLAGTWYRKKAFDLWDLPPLPIRPSDPSIIRLRRSSMPCFPPFFLMGCGASSGIRARRTLGELGSIGNFFPH
jgi:hypothetical protein